MRTLCDVCESAADQAALCRACDHEVHMCSKLARRHVRVGLTAAVRRIRLPANLTLRENKQYENGLSASMVKNSDACGNMDCNLIDLNAGPQRINCQKPDNQDPSAEVHHR